MSATATPASADSISSQILDAAKALGFAAVGITPVEPMRRGAAALKQWLDAGMHGDMGYMHKHATRSDPRALLDEARSVIVVALPYDPSPAPLRLFVNDDAPEAAATGRVTRGVVARYARGRDYHGVLKAKLSALADRCSAIIGAPVLSRACVDTAPLLEREAAHRSGVGFIAKNTMAIVPGVGSYVVLGELLVNIDLELGHSAEPRCGQCTACLDACPTAAFVAPHVLDARRCVSYLTIEHRGPIPRELRPAIGTMVFGCDICQEVCPFNAKPAAACDELVADPSRGAPLLQELLELSASAYRRYVRGSAMNRVSRHQLARNAAVALGNAGDRRAVPALTHALNEHISPLVRGHAAWALGRLGGSQADRALKAAADDDSFVCEEIDLASRPQR